MDNQGNRLYLNIANNNNSSSNRLGVNSDRGAYPTTPSTFPQPVYPPQQGQPGAGGMQQPQQNQQQQYAYPQPNNYFNPNQQYPPAGYPAPAMQSHHTDFAQGPYNNQGRSNTPGASNDPNTGLAHQFSHQNLGGARSGGYAARGPSPAGPPRPRTAGGAGQQPSYGYLNAPMPGQQRSASPEFEAAPERNPDKFGSNANNNQKKCSQLAADFFKDSVKRARERNQR